MIQFFYSRGHWRRIYQTCTATTHLHRFCCFVYLFPSLIHTAKVNRPSFLLRSQSTLNHRKQINRSSSPLRADEDVYRSQVNRWLTTGMKSVPPPEITREITMNTRPGLWKLFIQDLLTKQKQEPTRSVVVKSISQPKTSLFNLLGFLKHLFPLSAFNIIDFFRYTAQRFHKVWTKILIPSALLHVYPRAKIIYELIDPQPLTPDFVTTIVFFNINSNER